MTQLGFDLDALIREAEIENLPDWDGAPLKYHEDYYQPEEHDRAWKQWQLLYGVIGSFPKSQMWRVEWAQETGTGHHMHWLATDGRGWFEEVPSVTGSLMDQANCATCEWHFVSANEREVVHAYHDHAFPGWRDLPAVPLRIRQASMGHARSPGIKKWVAEHYPAGWGVHGAPVVTERVRPGTRDVSGYSPWRGFDIAKEVEEEECR